MPIYDYQCQSCQFKSEVMRKISAPSTENCPQCGLETFSKQLSAPSFQLSGSGWYATDFKNNGAKPSAKSATSEPNTESSKETKDASSESNKDSSASAENKPSAAGCQTGCACH